MRRVLVLSVLLGCLTGGVAAQDSRLQSLETGDDASPWEAVGRLDIGGRGFCTGAMIAPDLVLTAAHCLFDKTSGEPVPPSRIEFLAGWRNGRASAYRAVTRAVLHPDFVYGGPVTPDRIRVDLALLQLDHPIRNTTIKPFATAERPGPGARVGVVSYARDRSEAPSLQEVCDVLAAQDGVLVTSCSVDFGASGAPIFAFDAGAARIVSVVSAKAQIEGEDVSLGTDLDQPLQFLRAELERGSSPFQSGLPTVTRGTLSEERGKTGAKFIRVEP